jgi:hypothetical protein
MTATEFVEVVRKGDDKLRVDDIVVCSGDREVRGKGMLHIQQERIELVMTLAAGEKPFSTHRGIFTKSDGWKLSGVIEDRLQFRCDYVSPTPGTSSYHELTPTGGYDATHKATFRLHPINLVPVGLETLSTEERNRFYSEIQGVSPTSSPTTDLAPRTDVRFQACLRNYPHFVAIAGAELKGEFGEFEYVLARATETADVTVSLKSKATHYSASQEDDWRRFRALMDALGFVHGTHPWPYHIEYWRDGRKLTDRVTAAAKLASTHHAPFSEALEFHARTGEVKWSYSETLSKVASFFENDSVLRQEVAILLFLFREADNGVHAEITTLAMCTLFENLVHLIFKECHLKGKALKEDPNLELFEKARGEIAEHVTQRATAEDGGGYTRWQRVITTSQLFTQREKLQAVVRHFGLKWDDDMELVFKTWQKGRNPLVHDKPRSNRSEAEFKESAVNESRIAGAINILLLKLFGYAGPMRVSAFEDKFRLV